MWLFTPWNDKKDLENYKKSLVNSHAWLGGFGITIFYPVRWIARILVLFIAALIIVPIVISIIH